MAISPIGLQKDMMTPERPVRTAAERPAKEASPEARQAAPGARAVTVDLPEPMPGRLQLHVDRESGRVIGRIVDKESGRLIRQVPSDEALRLAASAKQLLKPLFVTQA